MSCSNSLLLVGLNEAHRLFSEMFVTIVIAITILEATFKYGFKHFTYSCVI